MLSSGFGVCRDYIGDPPKYPYIAPRDLVRFGANTKVTLPSTPLYFPLMRDLCLASVSKTTRSFWNHYNRPPTSPFKPIKINTVILEPLQQTPQKPFQTHQNQHGHFGTITTDPPKALSNPSKSTRSFWNHYNRPPKSPFKPIKINTVILEPLQQTPQKPYHGHFGKFWNHFTADPPPQTPMIDGPKDLPAGLDFYLCRLIEGNA